MTRLKLIVISMILAILTSYNADAQESRYTLFAVDLSLSSQQRNMAYDVIREVTLIKPNEHSIGLTLFDDTVRRFIAPAKLDKAQIRAINEAIADSLVSVRSSSNLAVGVERAIDNLMLSEPANLVIFTRGKIDTPNQDPRARFKEWLELVLMPQAAEENISITLVVPHQQFADPVIEHAFTSASAHNMVISAAGEPAAPALINLLGIADRPYGEVDLSLALKVNPPTPTDPQPNDLKPDVDTVIVSTNDAATSRFELPLTAKILFLIIATIVFCGIVYWRFRANQTQSDHSQSTTISSTYLPLTERPSNTMNSWIEDNADPPPPDSLDDRSFSDNEAPTRPSSKLKQKEQEPWE